MRKARDQGMGHCGIHAFVLKKQCHTNACEVCNGQLGSHPMSLPPFLARLTTYMHCTCMSCMHGCLLFTVIFLCAGALKTSAPHAWLVHPLWLHGFAHVYVHTNSNPTNLIAAFGWKS